MRLAVAGTLLLLGSALGLAYAQMPTGTVTGVVTDATGARVAAAHVSITNLQTAPMWALTPSAEGIYTAAALSPGEYRVTVETPGFQRIDRQASVEAGTTTSVDIELELERVTASVTVRRAIPLLHYVCLE